MSKAVFATLIALATIGAGISDANAAPRKHIRQARHSKVQETELPAKAGPVLAPPLRSRVSADDAADDADHALAEDATEHRFGQRSADLPTELLCVSRVRK